LLGLEGDAAGKLAFLHEAAGREETPASSSWSIYEQLQEQTRALLGPERYQQYLNLLHQHFEDTLLGTRSPEFRAPRTATHR
jgi:hypothetical protein